MKEGCLDPRKKTKIYSKGRTRGVRIVYALAILLWLFCIWALELYDTTWLGYLILALPILLFVIGMINACSLTVEVEETIFSFSYLSISLLIVFPLLAWIAKDYVQDKEKLIQIMIIAVVFALLSLFDIWVRPKWLTVVRHLKSIFQTLALTLLIFALYAYYLGRDRSNGTLV